MITIGMIHRRFQPFHNGHLDYLRGALGRAKRVIVGVTNPEARTIFEVSSDTHRHRADANPYPFYIRARMIQESILSCPACCGRFADVTIVPFPIHTPEVWLNYIPSVGVVQFMRILDPWDHEKKRTFEANGYKVEMIEGERETSGTEIRTKLGAGEPDWTEKVPEGTRRVLEALSLGLST